MEESGQPTGSMEETENYLATLTQPNFGVSSTVCPSLQTSLNTNPPRHAMYQCICWHLLTFTIYPSKLPKCRSIDHTLRVWDILSNLTEPHIPSSSWAGRRHLRREVAQGFVAKKPTPWKLTGIPLKLMVGRLNVLWIGPFEKETC